MNRKNRKRNPRGTVGDGDLTPGDDGDTRIRHRGATEESGDLQGGVKQVLLIILALHVVFVIGLVIFNQFNKSPVEEAAAADPNDPSAVLDDTAGSSAPINGYVVKTGDTLSGISSQFGISTQALADANGLALDDVLATGATLTIPEKPRVNVSDNATADDSAPSLERLINNAPRAMPAEQPALPDPDLPVRQTDTGTSAGPRGIVGVQHGLFDGEGIDPAPVSTSQSATPQASGKTYTVKSGDTMWSIARAHNTTPQKLQSLNNITDPGKLAVGTTLQIPAN